MEEGVEGVRLAVGRLELAFHRQGDRWGHEVTLGGRILLRSVEGAAADGDPRWPRSPVLTEVMIVEVAGGAAVVGVGLAGRSHFSAAFRADPRRADTLVCELACRIQERPEWLGSTYEDPDAVTATVAAATAEPPATVRWSYRVGPAGIEVPPP